MASAPKPPVGDWSRTRFPSIAAWCQEARVAYISNGFSLRDIYRMTDSTPDPPSRVHQLEISESGGDGAVYFAVHVPLGTLFTPESRDQFSARSRFSRNCSHHCGSSLNSPDSATAPSPITRWNTLSRPQAQTTGLDRIPDRVSTCLSRRV